MLLTLSLWVPPCLIVYFSVWISCSFKWNWSFCHSLLLGETMFHKPHDVLALCNQASCSSQGGFRWSTISTWREISLSASMEQSSVEGVCTRVTAMVKTCVTLSFWLSVFFYHSQQNSEQLAQLAVNQANVLFLSFEHLSPDKAWRVSDPGFGHSRASGGGLLQHRYSWTTQCSDLYSEWRLIAV